MKVQDNSSFPFELQTYISSIKKESGGKKVAYMYNHASFSALTRVKDQFSQDTLHDELISYIQDLETGYKTFIQEYSEQKKRELGKPVSLANLKQFFIPKQKIDELQKNGSLETWLENKIPLYEILGVTFEAIYEIYLVTGSCLEKDMLKSAFCVCRLLLTLSPFVADFWHTYAIILFRLNRFDDAITACKQTVGLNTQAYDAALLLIRSLYEVGRKEEAEAQLSTYLEEAQRQNDSDMYELFQYAQYHFHQKDIGQ